MQNKIIALVTLAALLLSGCMELGRPYDHDTLNHFTVKAVYPEGYALRGGAAVTIENAERGIRYTLSTGADGSASTLLQDGIYRVAVSDREGLDVFNASEDRVLVSGGDVSITLNLVHAMAGRLVVKEIYCGGCPKTPAEGTYQSDQYVIVHNNSSVVTYLDGLCLGGVAPYNSNGSNPWLTPDGALPQDFLPILDAIVRVSGNGSSFPLEPGGDAVICLRGAIDHAAEYPLSVNLNKPDYFVLYNPNYFDNERYHPAPGNLIREDHYLEVVIKTGQSNAYTLSMNSPAFVLFQPGDVDLDEYLKRSGSVRQTPGSSVYVSVIPPEWVTDGVEVFNGSSSGNRKRLLPGIDAGYVSLSETYKGRTLMRKKDNAASDAAGYEILQDTNNSSNDFYERETQSLRE